ncbi:DUF4191 domain-containing protein [Kocuria sp. JC486]|uniref:DUF4191 domain-containing protein n=1 Tax=Kocuria soli TaxID=2485125 RepID=A0A3N3ZV63_9MICC|nr:DUF4191 domain-containing protein [Kocuria soli]NHU84387.1 DUF4191 domain-containing protein [Kocuria sp. JC486]ROZ63971.1 DUF4191 domain-containing protein [Kocuria soli]
MSPSSASGSGKSNASNDAKSTRAAAREQKREEKARQKQAKGPGYLAQMKQVYQITKEQDSNITLKLIAIALGVLVIFLLLGLLLNNWITWLLIGIPFAVLAAIFYLSRRAEGAAFARIEDQPGAAGAALSTLRRGWIVDQEPVQIDPRTRDLVFRAVGRPGVVLVTEGPTGRVKKLVTKERRRIGPMIQNVPIHVINAGNKEDQVPLSQVAKRMKKLDASLTRDEVNKVYKRISTLRNNSLPIPKGVDPMRTRPDRKAMRGR